MKKIIISLIPLFFLCFQAKSQDNLSFYSAQIDSVQKVLDTNSKIDTTKVLALNHLARLYIADNQYDKGLLKAEESRKLASKIDYKIGEGLYLRFLNDLYTESPFYGLYHIYAYWHFTDINKAEPLYTIINPTYADNLSKRNDTPIKSEPTFKVSSHLEIAAHFYYVSAINAFRKGKLSEAIVQIKKAIPIFEELKLSTEVVNINLLYAKILNLEGNSPKEVRSLEFLVTRIIEKQQNTREKALLYKVLAVYYADHSQRELMLDNAFKAVRIMENLEDDYFLADAYFYFGSMFLFLDLHDKTVEYFDKVFLLITNNARFRNENIYFYTFYAIALSRTKNFEKAQKILEIAKSYGIPQEDILDVQGILLMEKGLYAEALEKFYDINELKNSKRYSPSNKNSNNYYIAECLSKLGRLKESNVFANITFERARGNELNIYSSFFIYKTCLLLYENYEKLGNEKQAFKYLKYYLELLKVKEAHAISERTSKLEIQAVINSSEDEKLALEKEKAKQEKANREQRWWLFSIAAGFLSSIFIVYLLLRNNRNKQKANDLLIKQKEEIDLQRNNVEKAFVELKATQAQLIQSEKMASLGELTAGIAHEIQNPLNFVNNFSELNRELVNDANEELEKGDYEETKAILKDIGDNSGKINHHGNRASSIVKGMLEHSRTSSGKKELTDLNALADEYLRLSYHGLRAKDKDFNADFETHFEPNLPKIEVISQEIGRVLLNLFNNAFQAVQEEGTKRKQQGDLNYKPKVSITTELKANSQLLIAIKDNGPGIPDAIKDKIFQPFFTTKPTGKGTGLGLSLAYDIVKAHGGDLTLISEVGIGTEFIISLLINADQ